MLLVRKPALSSRWQALLIARMRYHLALKTVGICLFMVGFFALYFELLRNPRTTPWLMPVTALDRWLPFTPNALVAYVSLWLYVGIPPGLMANLRELVVFGVWVGALCLTGLAIFYIAPTAVPPLMPAIDLANHPGFAVLQGVDASGNACPSLHVATAVFSACWVQQQLRIVDAPRWLRLASVLWCLAIVWSTLAVKQHVVLDAVAGAALGLAFAAASLRWRPNRA